MRYFLSVIPVRIYSGLLLKQGVRGFIQKFPDWIDKEINNDNNDKHSLKSNTKGYGGKTHKIAIQVHLVADNCTICCFRSRRPVRKILDTPLYLSEQSKTFE
jgi:hypothetical protein